MEPLAEGQQVFHVVDPQRVVLLEEVTAKSLRMRARPRAE